MLNSWIYFFFTWPLKCFILQMFFVNIWGHCTGFLQLCNRSSQTSLLKHTHSVSCSFRAQESGHTSEGFSASRSHRGAIQSSTGAIDLWCSPREGLTFRHRPLRVQAEFLSSGGRTTSLCSCWPLAGGCSWHLEAAHGPSPSLQALPQHGSLLL